jgi:hypothetical protein
VSRHNFILKKLLRFLGKRRSKPTGNVTTTKRNTRNKKRKDEEREREAERRRSRKFDANSRRGSWIRVKVF